MDVAEQHLWEAWRSGKRRRTPGGDVFNEPEVIETSKLKQWCKAARSQKTRGIRPNWPCIPVCEEQPFNVTRRHKIGIDPYLLGLFLGDGYIKQRVITSGDVEHIRHTLDYLDYQYTENPKHGTDAIGFRITDAPDLIAGFERAGLTNSKSINKFIPDEYKNGSIETRYSILQGLMDSDGGIEDGRKCTYTTISSQLADDVAYIARSLGAVVTRSEKMPFYSKDGERVECNKAYRLQINHREPVLLFRLKRKRHAAATIPITPSYRRVVDVEVLNESREGRCITVSNPNGLYITNNFIVTHNSDALLIDALGIQQDALEYPSYRGILFRRTYGELQALIDRAQELYPQIIPGAKYHGTDKTYGFPSGAKIRFAYLDHPKDRFTYQGHAYQYVGWDELTQHETSIGYEYLLSRLRAGQDHNRLARYCRATCNPGGFGHEWVRDRWAIPDEGSATNFTVKLERDDSDFDTWHRRFIPARITDNEYLANTTYSSQLRLLGEMERRALLDGRWDVVDIEGAIYADEIAALHSEKRILNIPFERTLPVYTFWDLGRNDETAIWWMQYVGMEKRFMHYEAERFKSITYWGKRIKAFQDSRDATYGGHYMPHDVDVRQLSLNNQSRKEMFESVNVKPIVVVPRIENISEGIDLTREFLPTCYFDREGTKDGIKALSNYRRKYDEKQNVFTTVPMHTWASNGADAFRQAAQGWAVSNHNKHKPLKKRRRGGISTI